MHQEFSPERIEQEASSSPTPAEADHTHSTQRDMDGDSLPADITLAPELLNPDNLQALLLAWIRTPNWFASQTYLQTHSELLTEVAKQFLAKLISLQPDPHVQELLSLHRHLLQAARQHGVEAAYESLLQQEEETDRTATAEEALHTQVIAWLQTPDWETSQTHLQAHPQLLTDEAEQVLEALKHAQREEQARALISAHQVLLQVARAQGVEAAYQRVLVPQQEATLSNQEQENLLRQLEKWLSTPDWKRSQAYLEEHPRLLTSVAETLLARLYQIQQTDQARAGIIQHQHLLRTAREEGTAAAYRLHSDPALLNDAAIQLMQLYQARGQVEALNRALSYWQEALMLTLPDSPNRPGYLNNLGNGLRARYGRTGELGDLEAAIQAYEQAIQTTPPDSPESPGRLNNLGNGLRARYGRTGELADLEAAIQKFEQAVQATPPDSPDRPMYLNNLGGGLRARYGRTGELADLEAAIQAYEQAIQATPPESPDRPMYLNSLGTGLSARYGRTGALADLEAAIQAYEQAVQVTPPDTPDRPGRLSNLGNGLSDRYGRTGELADLEAAIIAWERS